MLFRSRRDQHGPRLWYVPRDLAHPFGPRARLDEPAPRLDQPDSPVARRLALSLILEPVPARRKFGFLPIGQPAEHISQFRGRQLAQIAGDRKGRLPQFGRSLQRPTTAHAAPFGARSGTGVAVSSPPSIAARRARWRLTIAIRFSSTASVSSCVAMWRAAGVRRPACPSRPLRRCLLSRPIACPPALFSTLPAPPPPPSTP